MLNATDQEKTETQAVKELARGVRYNSQPGISFLSPVAPEMMYQVLVGWASFSSALRAILIRAGIDICVARTARDVLPSCAFQSFAESDSYGRTHIDHTGAFFLKNLNQIVISEYILDRSHVPTMDNALSPSLLAQKVWIPHPVRQIAYAVRHETCHVIAEIDDGQRNFLPPYLRAEFRNAHEADVSAMGRAEKACEKGYRYFVPSHQTERSLFRALQETFAELGAQAKGGCLRGEAIIKDWPRCYDIVRRYLDTFEARADLRAEGVARPSRFSAPQP